MITRWSTAFVTFLCLSGTLFADIIDNSLRMRLNFDAAPVNNIVTDTSPSAGHPGTNANANWLASEAGRTGVMDFNAPLQDRITIPANAALNSTRGTISFWMKSSGTSSGGDFGAILFDRRTTRGDVIVLQDEGTIFVQAREAGQNQNVFSSSGLVNDGQWHHIAYVYDQSAAGSISLYIDGVLDTTQANSSAWGWPATQPIELGSSHDPFWRSYEGLMDDFMVHNRMLSESEVAAAHAGTPVTDNSLVLRLRFDAAPVNDVVADSSASNNSGTNRGANWVSADAGRNGLMQFAPPAVNRITVAADPDFDVATGTIAFWMKSTGNFGPGDFGSILFDRRAGGNGDVIVMRNDGSVFVQAQGGGRGVNSFSTQSKVNDGQWHHVAYVFDQGAEGVTRVYIDGALGGSRTNSAEWAWPTEQPIELGSSHDTFWYAFDGTLDDVRFYNRPLTASEVVEIGLRPTLRFDIQPQSQTVFAGDDVTLNSAANVAAAYQWKLNGVNIAGATNRTLVLRNVQSANAGSYTVTATSALGEATSNAAILTVNPRPSLAASLVARYNFDAAPVNNVIVDSAPGAEHPGTNLLATWVQEVNGRTGVMQFVAADAGSQIVVSPHAEFDSSKGTIAFWMKSPGTGDPGQYGAILFDRRTDRGDVIVMQDDGALFVQTQSQTERVNSFATTNLVNDDTWHHVAYVYDQAAGGHVSIYLDGALLASNPSSGPWSWDPTQPLEIGKSHDPFWRRLDGYLDDIQFFNRMLSASEIAQIMNPGATQPNITIGRAGNQLTLSWAESGFALQENSNLGNPAGWTDTGGGSSSPVTITVPTTGNKFFRLRRPF